MCILSQAPGGSNKSEGWQCQARDIKSGNIQCCLPHAWHYGVAIFRTAVNGGRLTYTASYYDALGRRLASHDLWFTQSVSAPPGRATTCTPPCVGRPA